MAKNITPKENSYEYAIHRGFVTADRNLLKTMVPKTEVKTNGKEIMKQEDIDRLLKDMMGSL